MLSVIVLAAGMSRRMGGKNKLLLPFGDSTVLETTLSNILGANVGEIIIVLGHEAKQVEALIAPFGITSVINTAYSTGMTSSIQAGIRAAAADTEGFMICLGDMPLIDMAVYRHLAEVFRIAKMTQEKVIARPVYGNIPGNPVLFSSNFSTGLLALQFTEGAKPLVEANRAWLVEVPVNSEGVLMDADTEGDYERLVRERNG